MLPCCFFASSTAPLLFCRRKRSAKARMKPSASVPASKARMSGRVTTSEKGTGLTARVRGVVSLSNAPGAIEQFGIGFRCNSEYQGLSPGWPDPVGLKLIKPWFNAAREYGRYALTRDLNGRFINRLSGIGMIQVNDQAMTFGRRNKLHGGGDAFQPWGRAGEWLWTSLAVVVPGSRDGNAVGQKEECG